MKNVIKYFVAICLLLQVLGRGLAAQDTPTPADLDNRKIIEKALDHYDELFADKFPFLKDEITQKSRRLVRMIAWDQNRWVIDYEYHLFLGTSRLLSMMCALETENSTHTSQPPIVHLYDLSLTEEGYVMGRPARKYFGIVLSMDTAKEMIGTKYVPDSIEKVLAAQRRFLLSTGSADETDKIRRWAAAEGITIPKIESKP